MITAEPVAACPQIVPDKVCPPTTLTFQGAALTWQGAEPEKTGFCPALRNSGTLSVWAAVTIRITRFDRQGWRNATELAAALDIAFRIIHVNPEGVTAMLERPLEPGGACLLFPAGHGPVCGQPIPVELQGLALPSSGIDSQMAARLLLPTGGVR